MRTWKWLAAGMVLCAATAHAQEEAAKPNPSDPPPKPATTRVVAVTVYQGNALVTREVAVPEGKGLVEVVVTPLPPQTIDGSLYTKEADGLRVLSTRYRTRAVKADTRKEVRAKEEQIKKLHLESERIQKEVQVIEQNLLLLGKLENFTAATMQQLAEKGMLNSETTIALSKYVMETRASKTDEQVALQQKLQANTEAAGFAQRELTELAAGSSRTERDAVIVVDKGHAAAGTVRLNYLVGSASWSPQYRFRAGKEKDPIQLEYLAAIEQQSGEDWTGVEMILSTAQPMLNATPPELLALDITVIGRGQPQSQPGGGPGQAGQANAPMALGGMAGMGGGMGGMGGEGAAMSQQLRDQSRSLRKKAQEELNFNRDAAGGAYINQAAALEQAEELLARKDEREDAKQAGKPDAATATHEGPSVTYHLRSKLTVPSRNDQQLIEVARLEMAPDYFYKAVPVLTSHVYRLANLMNKSEYVLLPGEATMYVGSDFVGRMNLPLVAIGERYTVGFGVDPQLQVGRQLVKTSRTVQGGNQVQSHEYRITVSSYKSEPVKLQVWDRMPRAESESVVVNLVEPTPKLSEDPAYLRVERPANLLRWDLTVEPGMSGEKSATIAYQFKLEYAREMAIADLKTKK